MTHWETSQSGLTSCDPTFSVKKTAKNKINPSFNVKKFKHTNFFHCYPWELHEIKPFADSSCDFQPFPLQSLFLKVPHLHRCQHHVTYTSHASSKWPEMTVIPILQGQQWTRLLFFLNPELRGSHASCYSHVKGLRGCQQWCFIHTTKCLRWGLLKKSLSESR